MASIFAKPYLYYFLYYCVLIINEPASLRDREDPWWSHNRWETPLPHQMERLLICLVYVGANWESDWCAIDCPQVEARQQLPHTKEANNQQAKVAGENKEDSIQRALPKRNLISIKAKCQEQSDEKMHSLFYRRKLQLLIWVRKIIWDQRVQFWVEESLTYEIKAKKFWERNYETWGQLRYKKSKTLKPFKAK